MDNMEFTVDTEKLEALMQACRTAASNYMKAVSAALEPFIDIILESLREPWEAVVELGKLLADMAKPSKTDVRHAEWCSRHYSLEPKFCCRPTAKLGKQYRFRHVKALY